jgi:hypothetical protein
MPGRVLTWVTGLASVRRDEPVRALLNGSFDDELFDGKGGAAGDPGDSQGRPRDETDEKGSAHSRSVDGLAEA